MNDAQLLNSLTDFDTIPNDVVTRVPLESYSELPIWRIIAICFSVISFQTAYSVEYAVIPSLLKNLDIKGIKQTLFYLIGPVAGLFIQPIVSHYSDINRSRFGRRRPFIVIGGIIICIGYVVMYFILADSFRNRNIQILLLAITLIIINVAINMVQAPSRAIVGDLIPKKQQILAHSISAIMISFAGCLGNLCGQFAIKDLKFLSRSQIIVISGVGIIALGIILTSIFAREEPLTEIPARESPFKEIVYSIKEMPTAISCFAIVNSFAWMAYFPFQILIASLFADEVFSRMFSSYESAYEEGMSFGMLVLAVSNGLGMLYLVFQPKILDFVHARYIFFASQIIAAASLIGSCFLSNKIKMLICFAPIGISLAVCNSLPFVVISVTIPNEQMAVYMSIMNIFVVTGQLIELFICHGLSHITKSTQYIIGSSSLFALISAALCFRIDKKISLKSMNNTEIPEYIHDPIK